MDRLNTLYVEYYHTVIGKQTLSCLLWKPGMVWLLDDDKSLMIRLAVSAEYRRVTDGQTDILPRHHSPRYAYMQLYSPNGSNMKTTNNSTKHNKTEIIANSPITFQMQNV